MELHLFRHGQTDWNAERRAQGQSESMLTELGREQARELGQRISHIEFDQLYCSSSVRTRETAELAFSHRPALHDAATYLDSLREIHLGPWEGQLYADIQAQDPDSFAHFWEAPHLFAVPGAESFDQLQARAMTTISELAARHAGERVALVSHGALIKAALCHVIARPLSELWAPPTMHNCAHSIVDFGDPGRPMVLQIADQPVDEN